MFFLKKNKNNIKFTSRPTPMLEPLTFPPVFAKIEFILYVSGAGVFKTVFVKSYLRP